MKFACLALAAFLLAPAAYADGLSVTTGLSAGKVETATGDLEYYGPRFILDGSKGNLRYGVDSRVGELDKDTFLTVEAEAAYLFGGLVGPKVKYEYANIDVTDTITRTGLVGLAGEYPATETVKLYGEALKGENDTKQLLVGGAFDLGPKVNVFTEGKLHHVGDEKVKGVELGFEYSIDGVGSVDTRLIYAKDELTGGIPAFNRARGISTGLTINF